VVGGSLKKFAAAGAVDLAVRGSQRKTDKRVRQKGEDRVKKSQTGKEVGTQTISQGIRNEYARSHTGWAETQVHDQSLRS